MHLPLIAPTLCTYFHEKERIRECCYHTHTLTQVPHGGIYFNGTPKGYTAI
jgi:hypothetical protein